MTTFQQPAQLAELRPALEAADVPATDVVAHADLGALLDSIPDPIILLDTSGALRLANRAYQRLLEEAGLPLAPLGVHAEALQMRDYAGRRTPTGMALARAREGHETNLDRVLRMPDGRDRSFAVSGTPVLDDTGTTVGVAIVLHEETERLARERALRLLDEVRRGLSLSGDLRHAARAVCRRVIQLLPWVDMAVVYELEGQGMVFLSQAGFPARAARLLQAFQPGPGHRPLLALELNRLNVFQTHQDEPTSEAARKLVVAAGAATMVNLPLASGSRQLGSLTLASRQPHVLTRVESALLAALAAQVGAELEAVRRREEAEAERVRLQTVLDELPEAVLLFDAAGRLNMSNRRAEAILGQQVDPATPVIGLAARYGLLRPDGRPFPPAEYPLADVFMSERPVLGVEQLVRRPDGSELPIVASAAPVRGAHGQLEAVAFLFQDITTLREMDRLKDEFLSMAGHELRTPITSIRGLAQLLIRRPEQLGSTGIANALATIKDQTDQMTALVDELLDLSRIRTGRLSLHMEPCELGPLLHTAVESAQAQRDGPVTLTAEEPLLVQADGARLLQVFTNLLNNASKYSRSTAPITVNARSDGGRALISVTDRGIGIPVEDAERIFERFYRAPNATEYAGGLGLGLYLCAELVGRHGGAIHFESKPAAGTTFTVSLPLLVVERDE